MQKVNVQKKAIYTYLEKILNSIPLLSNCACISYLEIGMR